MNIESNPFNIIDILDNLYAQTGNDNYRLLSANIKASASFEYDNKKNVEENVENNGFLDFSLITDSIIKCQRLKNYNPLYNKKIKKFQDTERCM